MPEIISSAVSKDYLWPHLRDLPYFRGLLRAIEARYYQNIDLPAPTLDIGCGDGHFATIAFNRPLEVGIDPWTGPIREAHQRHAYRGLVQCDGARAPFPAASFGSAVSNSVLEHIPHLDAVLQETGRLLRPGAPFVFCVPNHQFLASLSIGCFLDRIDLHGLGDAYRAFFNRIARHEHCDPPEVWQRRLQAAGFEIERWWHYYPPASMHVTEWGHYFGLPALISKKLTGRWILVPQRWNLALTERLTRPHYDRPSESPAGVCTFYVARRRPV